MAVIGLLDCETHDNFEFVFNELKKCSGNEEFFIFIVNKDFREINTLRIVSNQCKILLCRFYIIKYMKGLVASAIITVVEKHSRMKSFKSNVYSKNYGDLILKSRDLKNKAYEFTVRLSSKQQLVLLTDYYKKNWESCSEMWLVNL